jgi:hypothetical protein
VATAAASPKASLSKSDVIDQLATSQGLSKAQVSAVLNGALDLIQETVRKGEKVTLTGCAAPRARAAACSPAALAASRTRPDTQKPGFPFRASLVTRRRAPPRRRRRRARRRSARERHLAAGPAGVAAAASPHAVARGRSQCPSVVGPC